MDGGNSVVDGWLVIFIHTCQMSPHISCTLHCIHQQGQEALQPILAHPTEIVCLSDTSIIGGTVCMHAIYELLLLFIQ